MVGSIREVFLHAKYGDIYRMLRSNKTKFLLQNNRMIDSVFQQVNHNDVGLDYKSLNKYVMTNFNPNTNGQFSRAFYVIFDTLKDGQEY